MDKETTRIGDFINFGVEIEASEGDEKSGGGKISIASVVGLGGELSRTRQERSINRVVFEHQSYIRKLGQMR